MTLKTTIGIVAPSAVVPKIELGMGVKKLKDAGFAVSVHPQCRKQSLFFAGNDEARAQAFYEYAIHTKLDVLWCARGGYGSFRILPLLEKLTAERGIPERKLLVGYSDSTAIMEFVRNRWGWETLHAPMPGVREFLTLDGQDWEALGRLVRAQAGQPSWAQKRLKFVGRAPTEIISAPMVGGNLSVWVTLLGTPFTPQVRDKILFFEDVGEGLYRVDRMVQQLAAAGGFDEVKAIVLGQFSDCLDVVPHVLKAAPKGKTAAQVLATPAPKDLVPLRKSMEQEKALAAIFGQIGREMGIPVAMGLPVGHGGGRSPLPLGADFKLTPGGRLSLSQWDWLSQ